ncbi:hypothetical protein EVAR_85008_1 [Eumeta japonica]|uniref:Uncharacterized protein n=1 Tax=Eumeta variegata TaxID=151549 RepID=A0A4C1W7R8_EUMVA|nr:hypothetical protein EVAR_85008_1 [Eumeta japonica]
MVFYFALDYNTALVSNHGFGSGSRSIRDYVLVPLFDCKSSPVLNSDSVLPSIQITIALSSNNTLPAHNNGHVSRSHLRRVLARLAVLPAAAQVRALEVRYLNHCGFDYVKLLEELDARPPESSAFLQMPPTARTGPSGKDRSVIETNIVQILAKIKGKMISEGVRPRDFLSQFDLHREFIIPRADFYRGLATAGVSLTPLEMDTVMDVFASPRRRRFVDYTRFCDTLEEVFTQRGLERAPLLEPLKPLAILDTPFNFLNFDERHTVSMALAKLAKYPDKVSNILEAFRSLDVANCGTVPRASAERVLDQRKLLHMLSPRERETLYTCFGYRRGCGTELNYRALCDALDVLYAIGTQSPC